MVALFRDTGQSGMTDLDSRRKMAQMLQSMQPNQAALASNSPLLAAAVPIIQALMAKKMERNLQGEQDALKATREQDLQDMLAAYRGTPEQTVMPQNIDTAEGGDIPPPSVIPAKPGGQKALVEAMLAAKSPEYRNAGLQALVGGQKERDTPEIANYLFRGKLETPEEQTQFDLQRRAPTQINLGDRILAMTPGGTQRYNVNLKPGELPSVRGAQAAAVESGKETSKQQTELTEMESNLPRLEVVVEQLSGLGKNATYTKSGQAYDIGRREVGLDPRESAIARKEYISKVDNEVLPLLRQTFGAQFTQKEGESLKATLGDPNASPAEKEAVLRSFIDSKRAQVETQKRKLGKPSSSPSIDELLKKY